MFTSPNSITSIRNYTFRYCSLTSITIPNTVTSIGKAAFAVCSALTSITIPNSVTSIGQEAFAYCNGLTSIYACSVSPIILNESWIFNGVPTNTCILHVPIGSKTDYQKATQWKDFINIIEGTTALQTEIANEFGVSVKRDKVLINNLLLGEVVQVFTIDGKKVFSEKTEKLSIEIQLPTNKMYIVKIGTKSAKIIF
ncbi:MAG: leucine-rich repeat domain-containing protein [Paludibacter sp.]